VVSPVASKAPSIEAIRARFPSLQSGFIYLENAGGSQVPREVADAMREYMLNNYVQLGAGYEISQRSTAVVAEAHLFINELMNGKQGQTILGPSSTQLFYMLAECYSRALHPGDQIIIAETGHEANVGPWAKLSDRGFDVRVWRVDPQTRQCSIQGLQGLLCERTKIVAFPHVSNLLGEIVDVKQVTEIAHRAGARVVVDGVAYAPHRAIDVDDWDVDWYAYSTYKVFGPHMGALYGKQEAFEELTGPNHFFIPKDNPYKFQLGGASHEGCAGLLALKEYFAFLTGSEAYEGYNTVKGAFEVIELCELPVQKALIDYLRSKPEITIIGPEHGDSSRVCTVSFTHSKKTPIEIVAEVDRLKIGIRYGHMYAYRLCRTLGIDTQHGVVRVSAAHYNTVEEIKILCDVLESVL
jgi:cysteine desulfurase family protein (TIGR01976 family)